MSSEYEPECAEGVTRRDEYEPCDKPAVAVRLDPECGEPYPVCARHARADMVLLPDLIAAVRAQAAAAIEARQIICPIHHMPDCSPLLNGCSLPIHLHEQRAIDAGIVRGESS